MNVEAEKSRPAVPEDLKRQVLIEAGHRCAIPTCKATTTEIAHIVPWKDCKAHTFTNLIALCPNCHTRFDHHEIDRKSMLAYKRNLSLINSRYGDAERRVLRLFADHPQESEIRLPGGLDLLLWYLVEDGILEDLGPRSMIVGGFATSKVYRLTESGRAFVEEWKKGGELR